jgi:hypothetical protein
MTDSIMPNHYREKILQLIHCDKTLCKLDRDRLKDGFRQLLREYEELKKADEKSGGFRIEDHTTEEDRKKGQTQLQIVPFLPTNKVIFRIDGIEKEKMDHTKCIKCKAETEIELGTLPGEGYQCGFFINCTECGYTKILLIDENKFDVEFKSLENDVITFVLKGKIEKNLL